MPNCSAKVVIEAFDTCFLPKKGGGRRCPGCYLTLSNWWGISAQLKNANLDVTAKSAGTAIDSGIVAVSSLRNTLNSTEKTIQKVDVLAQNLSNGEGSLGKLLTDDALYTNLMRTTRHLSLLEQDLRLNPKRYTTVKLKLIGKNKTPGFHRGVLPEPPQYAHPEQR